MVIIILKLIDSVIKIYNIFIYLLMVVIWYRYQQREVYFVLGFKGVWCYCGFGKFFIILRTLFLV